MKPDVTQMLAEVTSGRHAARSLDWGSLWFFCREHDRAESSKWAQIGCSRIGPFESEDEVHHYIKRQHLRGT